MNSIELIREFLKDRLNLEPEKVVPEAVLAELGVDSLLMLELMFEFEDRFNIQLSNDITTPKTVDDMAKLMNSLIDSTKT